MSRPHRRTAWTWLVAMVDFWDRLALLLLVARALHRLAAARHRPRAHGRASDESVALAGSNVPATWGQSGQSTSWDADAERRTDVRRERRLLLAEIAAIAVVVGLVLVRAALLS